MIFYVDVYFLINFTVDILALYFAALLTKVSSSVKRIVLLGALGAVLAVVQVLFDLGFFAVIIFTLLLFLSVAAFISKRISFYRRAKTAALFLVFETLVGGLVSFGYGLLDKYFYSFFKDTKTESPNRNLIILSVLILLSIGVFRLLALFFSHSSAEKNVRLEISLSGSSIAVEALVDTGNLLREPVSLKPVILLKSSAAVRLSGSLPTRLEELSGLSGEMSRRITLIPLSDVKSSRILVGFRADEISVLSEGKKGKRQCINAVVAIDTEGGNYGGYEALAPSCVLDDV